MLSFKVVDQTNCCFVLPPHQDENRRSEEREWMGVRYVVHFFNYENKYMIWGLTAGILIRAASLVYQRPPAFLEQLPEFKYPTYVSKDTTMP